MQLFTQVFRALYPGRGPLRFDGITLRNSVAENIARNLYENARKAPNHLRLGFRSLFQALRAAIDQNNPAVTLVNADARFTDAQVALTEGEEAFHRAVVQATGGENIPRATAEATLQSSHAMKRAAANLKQLRSYLEHPSEILEEIAASVRNGEWDKLVLSAEEAEQVWQQFIDVIAGLHSEESAALVQSLAHSDHASTQPRASQLPAEPAASGESSGVSEEEDDDASRTRFESSDRSERSDPSPASRNGVTLGSGLGALQPALEKACEGAVQFTREAVVPKVASILRGGRDAANYLLTCQLFTKISTFHLALTSNPQFP